MSQSANTAEMAERERRRIVAMRMQMVESHPFWGYILLQVKLLAATGLPAFAATDGVGHIWYNPLLTSHLTNRQLGFVLAHEVAHQLFLAVPRRAGRDPVRWNMAMDYVINRIVVDIEDTRGRYEPMYDPPAGDYPGIGHVQALVNPDYRRLMAESIYERIPEERAVPCLIDLDLPLDPGDRDGDYPEQRGAPEPTESGEAEKGRTLRFSSLVDHRGGIDVHLPVDLSPEQREALQDRIGEAVEYRRASRGSGHVPDGLLRSLHVLDRPRVPWERVLHSFMDQALNREEYSRSRPNRKYWEMDALVPGLEGQEVESIVVALDTSGSMTPKLLASVMKEIRRIAENTAEITLIVADEHIHEVVAHDDLDEYLARPAPRGGGGTDHRPVFQYLEDHRIRPSVFVGLTDLESEFPKKAPPYPVLWAVPYLGKKPPWGQRILVEE